MLGLRWNINDYWIMAGDADLMDGSYRFKDVNPLTIKRQWNFYSLLVLYRF